MTCGTANCQTSAAWATCGAWSCRSACPTYVMTSLMPKECSLDLPGRESRREHSGKPLLCKGESPRLQGNPSSRRLHSLQAHRPPTRHTLVTCLMDLRHCHAPFAAVEFPQHNYLRFNGLPYKYCYLAGQFTQNNEGVRVKRRHTTCAPPSTE